MENTQMNKSIASRKGKWKAMLALALLCFNVGNAWAVDWTGTLASGTYTLTTTTGNKFKVNNDVEYDNIGNINVTAGNTVTIVFDNSNTIFYTGAIRVEKGTLTLQCTDNAPTWSTLRKKDGFPNSRIVVFNTSTTNPEDCQLFINGSTNRRFTINGCMDLGSFTVVPNGSNDYTVNNIDESKKSNYGLLFVAGGKVFINKVDFRNNWVVSEGTIRIMRSSSTAISSVTLNDCKIYNNYAELTGAALYVSDDRVINGKCTSLIMTNCEVYGNFTNANDIPSNDPGGTIRTAGSHITNLKMNDCIIRDNYSRLNGGGIYWNGYRALEPVEITNCTIKGNWAGANGGGVINSRGLITSCKILNNHANACGGGFFHSSYATQTIINPFYPSNNIITLDDQTVIEGNTCGIDGGGIFFQIKEIITGSGSNQVWHVLYNDHVDEHGNHDEIYKEYLNINGAIIRNNTATRNGGGVFLTQTFNQYDSDLRINYGFIDGNVSTDYFGGGVYIDGGASVIMGSENGALGDLNIRNNSAKQGGGICLRGGNLQMYSGNIGCDKYNYTDTNGEYHSNVSGKNVATKGNGGGIFVNGGNLTMMGGTVSYNHAVMEDDTGGNGGGFYVTGGTVAVKGGTITENTADENGGGFYVSTASATDETQINSDVAATTISSNHAKNGAGVYVDKGNLRIEDASTNISDNVATGNGGGICIDAPDDVETNIYFTSGSIANNEAVNGGGLYIMPCNANLDFTSGTFSANQASSQGGGIYISEGAVLNLQGVATLTGNHVPATGKGGGIYMNGTLNVGGGTGTQSMKCNDNYAGASYSLATQNNVYLPSRTKYITLKSDISNKTNGVYDTQIGITANGTIGDGGIPVVYVEDAANEPWLYALMADISTAGGAVFDDTQSYIAIHTRRTVGGFDKQFIYFSGCWTTVVTTNPGESHIKLVGDTYHIYTNQGLAWFSSLVNGLNLGSAAPANTYSGPQPQLKAKLEADVDMGQYLWVPLGAITGYNSSSSTFTESTTQAYTGEFDGQGHVIKGINNGYLTGITRYGLFGTVGNGTVKNTFLDNYTNLAVNSGQYFMGGIAGYANGTGTVFNCEARGGMDLTEATNNSYAGGIVGYSGGSIRIHSCMAMPEMTGTANSMGGITGATNGPSKRVINCYAIPMFTNVTCGYVGGLVGWNNGQIRNCYVRLRGAKPANFGWFAAHNHFSNESNKGIIEYCYAPSGETNYVVEQNGTLTGHGNYAATALVNGKYGFAHQDQDVTLASGQSASSNTYIENGHIDNDGELKGLLSTLNNWVEDQNDGVEYSTWTRTMGSPINADLPILEFDDFVSAGSTDNVFIAYKADLNDMIDYANANSTGGSVYLYDATPTAVNKSTNGNVRVYIDPNVGITQATGNTLNARVGVALDNSSTGFMAYDWHMFSSALRSAPMGLVYHSEEGTYYVRDNYATLAAQGITHGDYTDPTKMDPPMTTWNTTPGQIGYFPTDAPYGSWRGTPDSRGSFDFYCYHEPSRHWINFKREGKAGFFDHWNQYVYNPATDKHTQIQYTNESTMVSGKGYMVALSQPSMMMADGVLNNTATQSSNASYNEGSGYDQPLRGLNLVGNPYQSYLDFNQFANTNGIDTYYILDADAKGYIAYTTGSTPQPSEWIGGVKRYINSRYIHPHQGFFVMVDAVQTITFNSDMRKGGTNTNVDGGSSSYRDWEPRYALVNMVCTDGEGRNDFATIELDRPEQGGGRKAKGLRSGDASIWFRLGDEDYQIAFAPVGTASAPLRFEAHADGVYTLRWNMQNADFSYLHLVDNLTGTDIDCLSASEYVFEGKTTDYTSRFRLVFDFTGIEENDDPTEGSETFAFMLGDELVVNGEGLLQMFDLNGRQLFSTEIHGSQATVAMPKVADGIYVLRLTNGNQVRTQKMVINK